ncbi:MAG: hypothetical protein ACUVRS_09435 [Armatimonadota bacterium]
MSRKWLWFREVAIGALLVMSCTGCALSSLMRADTAERDAHSKTVVIVANRLLLSDFIDPMFRLPHIHRLIIEGSIGLISPNCEGPRTETAVLMTASCGYRSFGGDFVRHFYDADETITATGENAAEAFRRRTGFVPPRGSALFVELGQALRTIKERRLLKYPGVIGDLAHQAGLKTCAIGNADLTDLDRDRSPAVLAMDSKGIIDVGRLTVLSRSADMWLSNAGVAELSRSILECLKSADLVVVNFGESTLLDEEKPRISDEAYMLYKRAMLDHLDRLVYSVLKAQGEGLCGSVVVASFSVPENGYWNRLTPILVSSINGTGRLLTSSATRTPGLLAASDIPQLVAELLRIRNARRARMFCDGSLDTVKKLDSTVYANHTLMLPILCIFSGVAAVSFTGSSVLLAFRLRASKKVFSALGVGLLISAAAPLGMLLAAVESSRIYLYAFLMIVLPIVVALVARLVSRRSAATIIFGLTVLAVALDAIAGGRLCRFALPCSYQLAGYRYYGIGNEYAAALICMSALVALSTASMVRHRVAAALGLLTVALLGIGSLGGNYGATAAAVVTFGLIFLGLRDGGYRARHIIGLLVVGVLVAGGLAWFDWIVAHSAGSHGGRLIGEGLRELFLLATRKASMNVRLMVSEQAVSVYLAFAPFFVLWIWGVQPLVRELLGMDERLKAGLKALLVGTLAALILNDSGIVMFAIMNGMISIAVLYSLLECGGNANCGA